MAKKNKKDVIGQDYKGEDIIVRVREDEDAYFYAFKDGDEVGYCLKIRVLDKQTKKCLNQYWAELPVGANMGSYHQFMKKFLKDPEFREVYRVDEKEVGWNGIITFEEESSGIDKRCKERIDRLNQLKAPGFKDFMHLKTFGRDKVSSMKREALVEVLSEPQVVAIEEALTGEKNRLTAFRWVVRGLKPELAIRKVLTDIEVGNNIQGIKLN